VGRPRFCPAIPAGWNRIKLSGWCRTPDHASSSREPDREDGEHGEPEPGPGHDAEEDLGLRPAGIIGADPEIGSQGQFASAAERRPGDGGDDRLGNRGDSGDRAFDRQAVADQGSLVEVVELGNVGAGGESPLAAVDDHSAHVLVRADVSSDGGELPG
jgi:hypothetical protein